MSFYDGCTSAVAHAIGIFSPARALRYRALRASFAAASVKPQYKGWRPRNRSADAHIRPDSALMLARCRDLARNDAFIACAINRTITNVIRHGITPQARLANAKGVMKTGVNNRIEKLWANWATSPEHADVSGALNFYDMQALILRHLWTDGEILIRRIWHNDYKEAAPFHLELLESDFLDSTIDGQVSENRIIRRGIEFDLNTGRPVAYHLFDGHPGDDVIGWPQTRRVPAADVIHIFKKDRASQTRGVPWLSVIAAEAFDLNEYQASERFAARINSFFALFVKSSSPEFFSGDINNRGAQYLQGEAEQMYPGRIQYLPYGTEIQQAGHNRPGETYFPYVKTSAKKISAGVGMSYEAMSNDYADASYSSARAASLEERLSYQFQQNFIINYVCKPVARWFFEAEALSGRLGDYFRDPREYNRKFTWQAPGWTWVDPSKDAAAAKTELELGVTTRRKIAAQKGMDWDDIVAQLAREKETLESLGLSTAVTADASNDQETEPEEGEENEKETT